MLHNAPICANGGRDDSFCLYWTMFKNISDGILVLDFDDKGYISGAFVANDSICKISGFSKEEIALIPIHELFHHNSLPALKMGKDDFNANQSVVFDSRLKKKDKTFIHCEISFTKMFAHGRDSIIAVIRDTTERVKIAESRLMHERFVGVLETAGGACHELNQPLQAMLGYAGLLSKAVEKDTKAAKWANSIKEQIDRMAEITHKLNSITHYATQNYVDGVKILDISASASPIGVN